MRIEKGVRGVDGGRGKRSSNTFTGSPDWRCEIQARRFLRTNPIFVECPARVLQQLGRKSIDKVP